MQVSKNPRLAMQQQHQLLLPMTQQQQQSQLQQQQHQQVTINPCNRNSLSKAMSPSKSAATPLKNSSTTTSASLLMRSMNSKNSTTATTKPASASPLTTRSTNSNNYPRENKQPLTLATIPNGIASLVISNSIQSPSQKQSSTNMTYLSLIKANNQNISHKNTSVPPATSIEGNSARQPLQPRTDIFQTPQQQKQQLQPNKQIDSVNSKQISQDGSKSTVCTINLTESLKNSQQMNHLLPFGKTNNNNSNSITTKNPNSSITNSTSNPYIPYSNQNQIPDSYNLPAWQHPRISSRNNTESVTQQYQFQHQQPQQQSPSNSLTSSSSSFSPIGKQSISQSTKNNYLAYFKTGPFASPLQAKSLQKSKQIDLSNASNTSKKSNVTSNNSITSNNHSNSKANQHLVLNQSKDLHSQNNYNVGYQQPQEQINLLSSQPLTTQEEETFSIFLFNNNIKQLKQQQQKDISSDKLKLSEKEKCTKLPLSQDTQPSLPPYIPHQPLQHTTQLDSKKQPSNVVNTNLPFPPHIPQEIIIPTSKPLNSTTTSPSKSTHYPQQTPQNALNSINSSKPPQLHIDPSNLSPQTSLVQATPTNTEDHVKEDNKFMSPSIPDILPNTIPPDNSESVKRQKLSGFSTRLSLAKDQFTNLQSAIEKKRQEQIDNYHDEVARVEQTECAIRRVLEEASAKTKELLLQALNESLGICRDTAFSVTQILNYLSSTENDLISNLPSIVHDMDIPSLDEIINQYDAIIDSYNRQKESNFAAVKLSQVKLMNSTSQNGQLVNQTAARLAAELDQILAVTKNTPLLVLFPNENESSSHQGSQQQQSQQNNQHSNSISQQNHSKKSIYVSFENKDGFSSQQVQNPNQLSPSFEPVATTSHPQFATFKDILSNENDRLRVSLQRSINSTLQNDTLVDSPAFLNAGDSEKQHLILTEPANATSSFNSNDLIHKIPQIQQTQPPLGRLLFKAEEPNQLREDVSNSKLDKIQFQKGICSFKDENQSNVNYNRTQCTEGGNILQNNSILANQMNQRQEQQLSSLDSFSNSKNINNNGSFNTDSRSKLKYTELIQKIQVRQSQTEKLCTDVLSAGASYQQQETSSQQQQSLS